MLIVLALCIFIICPMLSIPFSFALMLIDKRKGIIYLILFCIALSLPALYFLPQINDDAYRIFGVMDQFNTASFESLSTYFKSIGFEYVNYPIFFFLMFIVKQTGFYQILSFIGGFFTYFFFLLPVVDFYRRLNWKKYTFSLIFLMIIVWNNYHYTISGIRFQMASAIVVSILYFEIMYLKTPFKYILYLIPFFIHPGIIPVILIRLFYPFLKRISSVEVAVFVGGILAFFMILPNLPTFGSGYLGVLLSKASVYGLNGYFKDLWTPQFFLRLLVSVGYCLFYLIVFSKRNIKKLNFTFVKNPIMNRLFVTVHFYVLATLCITPSFNLANRLELELIPLTSIVLAYVFSSSGISKRLYIFMHIVFCVMIAYGVIYNFNIENSPFIFPQGFPWISVFKYWRLS